MNNLYIETRDPLFGIIVFFALIFVITFFSYWWGRYKAKDDTKYLDRFIKDLNTPPSDDEIKTIIHEGNISNRSWLILAQSYIQQGYYEKAIEIYHTLLEIEKNTQQQQNTAMLLAQAYFKAGFLERAKEIFLKILKHAPRTPNALYSLLLVYDRLKEYKKALEVLEPLHELEQDIEHEKQYLECVYLLQCLDITHEEKSQKLLHIYRQNAQLCYLVFEYLFRTDHLLAWEHLNDSDYARISDILWYLPQEKLLAETISSHAYLRELFSAKGTFELAASSDIFELDILIKLHQSGHAGARLQFEYLCHKCKHVFPFAFQRCPNCHCIDSVMPQMLLTKESCEENYTF